MVVGPQSSQAKAQPEQVPDSWAAAGGEPCSGEGAESALARLQLQEKARAKGGEPADETEEPG